MTLSSENSGILGRAVERSGLPTDLLKDLQARFGAALQVGEAIRRLHSDLVADLRRTFD